MEMHLIQMTHLKYVVIIISHYKVFFSLVLTPHLYRGKTPDFYNFWKFIISLQLINITNLNFETEIPHITGKMPLLVYTCLWLMGSRLSQF